MKHSAGIGLRRDFAAHPGEHNLSGIAAPKYRLCDCRLRPLSAWFGR
jgi:hypothetical protein